MYNFNEVATLKNIRTKFKDCWDHKTTGNTGDLIPIYWKEILPGDFLKMDCTALIKMTTPSFQTMDRCYCDIHFYFVPRRLVWKHFKNFMGEKTVGPHEVEPEYTIPKTSAPAGGWAENTIADYLGIPTKVEGIPAVDSGYFRAYALICNEWYRDQNRQDIIDFTDGDENSVGSNGSNYVTDIIGGGKPFKAAKLHDYFTSSLLTPTGKERVELPLGYYAPVVLSKGVYNDLDYYPYQKVVDRETLELPSGLGNLQGPGNGHLYHSVIGDALIDPNGSLTADLSSATAATVNQLRLAFQLQKIFESNNIRGHRYVEQLKTRWNVTPSDATLQRPEYLGGKRFPLNIQMVVQSSSTDVTSPLGQVSGFSNTKYGDTYFSHGFEEHGILMGLAVIRHDRTYQQGLSRFLTRTNMEDFYTPEFQNLGEQAIHNYEIFASGNATKDNQEFGYQEYAAEYRSTPNRVSGQFRSNASNSFDFWHYADDYLDTPVNGEEWIMENVDSVDRTLTVTSATANQFYFDFHFEETNVRTMPPHSIPGFIDHH